MRSRHEGKAMGWLRVNPTIAQGLPGFCLPCSEPRWVLCPLRDALVTESWRVEAGMLRHH